MGLDPAGLFGATMVSMKLEEWVEVLVVASCFRAKRIIQNMDIHNSWNSNWLRVCIYFHQQAQPTEHPPSAVCCAGENENITKKSLVWSSDHIDHIPKCFSRYKRDTQLASWAIIRVWFILLFFCCGRNFFINTIINLIDDYFWKHLRSFLQSIDIENEYCEELTILNLVSVAVIIDKGCHWWGDSITNRDLNLNYSVSRYGTMTEIVKTFLRKMSMRLQ